MQGFAVGEGHAESRSAAGDSRDVGAVAYIDPESFDAELPRVEHRLARTGRKVQVAAERQDAGLGHDVFAFLVALDRIGVCGFCLEQHV